MKTIRIMTRKEFEKKVASSKQNAYGHDGSLEFYFADSVNGPPRILRKGPKTRLDQCGEINPVVVHFGE